MRSLKQLLYDQYLTLRYTLGKTKPYHSGERKLPRRIFADLLAWQFREGEFNTMYYAMGLHLRGAKQKEYIGRRVFLKIEERVERKLRERAECGGLRYDVVTRDKFYAGSIFSAAGLPSAENLALISDQYLITPDGRKEQLDSLLKFPYPLFIKNNTLEAGEGVMDCQIDKNGFVINGERKGMSDFLRIVGSRKWVVQRRYSSHAKLQEFNSTSLNSTRIYTILNHHEPEILCAYQGFATGKATSDSWQHGSLYVGLDLTNGILRETGVTSPYDKRSGLHKMHPDSNKKFEAFEIPYLKEAVNLCIRAHRLLYFHFIIGWDIAITDTGPMILEANERPGMSVAQALNGGLRKKIMEYAAKIMKEQERIDISSKLQ